VFQSPRGGGLLLLNLSNHFCTIKVSVPSRGRVVTYYISQLEHDMPVSVPSRGRVVTHQLLQVHAYDIRFSPLAGAGCYIFEDNIEISDSGFSPLAGAGCYSSYHKCTNISTSRE